MIPRTPTFHGLPDDVLDDAPDIPPVADNILASQAVGRHTQLVRDWLAAPWHERGHYITAIAVAWRDVRHYGMASAASMAANGIMQSARKLKGIK